MTKLIKHQNGKTINRIEDVKRDNTAVNTKIIPQIALRSPATGELLTGKFSKEDRVKAVAANNGTSSAKIESRDNKSLREKFLGSVHKFNDRVTGGQLITDPLRAGATLLRPDKYFENVTSDADIGDAILNVGGDVLSALPLAMGAKSGLKGVRNYLNVVPDELNKIKLEKQLSLEEVMAMTDDDIQMLVDQNPQIEKMLHNSWDPRTRAEIGIDKLHNSKLYNKTADVLNKSNLLKNAKTSYINKRYVTNEPITHESITKFKSDPVKRFLVDGELMVLPESKNLMNSAAILKGSKFGDGTLSRALKETISNKRSAKNSLIMTNNLIKDNKQIFAGTVDPLNKEIRDYSFFANADGTIQRADQIRAGRFADALIKRGPVNYIYDPGSLSGDSFTLYNKAIAKNADILVPTNSYGSSFGRQTPLNGHGKMSPLSKEIIDFKRGAVPDGSRVKQLTIDHQSKALKSLGLNPDDALATLYPGDYMTTPVKKVISKEGISTREFQDKLDRRVELSNASIDRTSSINLNRPIRNTNRVQDIINRF